eukprot:CAMPEP_0194749058 /NCGR_PEP_ID=MMETSP0323_2-20130528/3259_1 /TAXON_ID=2866 ORGANISM="Crypthecodinium cohnii, Strain Seligo" /NCGR_SAMPLE_ID=MMETSP0323_2 /ASSEMBLY_ACC=CAM_ASM_000346 /LENGTH=57 /DNA_ID=CAMNT_0039663865 /DNA_START=21 /DNA_END=195 /DNA_ORIENTATION=-
MHVTLAMTLSSAKREDGSRPDWMLAQFFPNLCYDGHELLACSLRTQGTRLARSQSVK